MTMPNYTPNPTYEERVINIYLNDLNFRHKMIDCIYLAQKADIEIATKNDRISDLESRIVEVAGLFGVCDGGKYINDWKTVADKYQRQTLRIAELETQVAELLDACDQLKKLCDFAEEIIKWSEAYPKDIFPEPTPEQIDEVCKQSGFRIDQIAAMVLRNFTKPWGDKAQRALKAAGLKWR